MEMGATKIKSIDVDETLALLMSWVRGNNLMKHTKLSVQNEKEIDAKM